MICNECGINHDGAYSDTFCSKRCYQKSYQRAYNKKRYIKKKERYDMRQVTEEEAYTGLFVAMIERAVLDATGRSTINIPVALRNKHEARVWLVQELPHILALTRDMDTEDIEAMRHELSLWVRCGCPQDGSFGPGGDGGGRQLGLWI